MAFASENYNISVQNQNLLDGTRFAVEKITDTFLGQDSKIYYKVKWQETWEPEERLMLLCAPMINEFWKDYYAKNQPDVTNRTEEDQPNNPNEPQLDEIQRLNNPICTGELSENFPQSTVLIQPSEGTLLTPAEENGSVVLENINDDSKRVYLPRMLSHNSMLSSSHRFELHVSSLETEKHVCTVCQQEFLSKEDLIKHEEETHGLTCNECGKTFEKKVSLNRHMLTHTSHRPHVCQQCRKGFKERSNLTKHMVIHTGARPFVCEICDARFRQMGHLIKHKLTHQSEKPFRCSTCDKGFKRKEHLKEHEIVHSGDFPYHCELCDRKFRFKNNLKVHVLQHSGLKDFVCSVCNKAFSGKANLVQHELIHVESFQHECPTCEKKFKRKGHLQRHMLIHDKKIVLMCQFCDKIFHSKSAHTKHLFTHSDGPKLLMCLLCNIHLPNKSALKEHQNIHANHDKIMHCKQCSKIFCSQELLETHIETHDREYLKHCEKCLRKFKKKSTLDRHVEKCSGTKTKPKIDQIDDNQSNTKLGEENNLGERHTKIRENKSVQYSNYESLNLPDSCITEDAK